MGKKKTKIDASTVPVPQDDGEAESHMAEIGTRQRQIERIDTEMNEEIAKIRAKHEKKAKGHADRIAALVYGLEIWAATNRKRLTHNEKTKTVTLPSGLIKWRMTPDKVNLRGIDDVVIPALKKAKLDRFIRLKEEVNKEAILADPDAVKDIKGISITKVEEFVVEPHKVELEAGA